MHQSKVLVAVMCTPSLHLGTFYGKLYKNDIVRGLNCLYGQHTYHGGMTDVLQHIGL